MGNSRKGYRISTGKYSNVKCRGEWRERNIDSTPFSFRLQPLYPLPSSEKVPTHNQGDISADLESIMKTTTPVPTTNQTLRIKPAGSYFTDCIVTPQCCLSVCKNSQFLLSNSISTTRTPSMKMRTLSSTQQHAFCLHNKRKPNLLPALGLISNIYIFLVFWGMTMCCLMGVYQQQHTSSVFRMEVLQNIDNNLPEYTVP